MSRLVAVAALALALASLTACRCGGASKAPVVGDAPRPVETPPVEAAPRALERVLEPLRGDLPALGGAIVEHGKVIAIGVTGVRAVGQTQRATRDDRWHLGSDTKAMTATLVARLVERGVLAWDTPLSELLPGVAIRADYRAVTPVQLLSHRAGLPGDLGALPSIWLPLWDPGDVVAQRALFAAQVLARKPDFPPGTFLYSNAGYMVMGAALEARTGKRWEQLMRDEVFAPLGMTACGFGMPDEGLVAHPWGHSWSGSGEPAPVTPGDRDDNPPALGPAGTVHCTLTDWARFVSAHLDEPASYLSSASWIRLHAPVGDDYALGWVVAARPWARGTVYAHTGSNTMNTCVVWIAPAIGRAYLAVTNRGGGEAELDGAIGALIQLPI